MILIDANILLYAYDTLSPFHQTAKQWLEEAFVREQIRFSWPGILAFLRISTRVRGLEHSLPVKTATAIVSEWLEQPNVKVLEPGERYWSILDELLKEGNCRGNLVMDAFLAALAIEHGAVLVSSDRDFSRFPVTLLNPLQSR